jgi:acyl carrier protein
MKGSLDEALKLRLKEMIIAECEKDNITPQEVADNIHLFSDASGLDLDSLDALQISVALLNQFGIRLPDSKSFRRHVTTINELADFIQPE